MKTFCHLSRSSSVSTIICPFTVIAFNSFGPSSISLAIAGSVIVSLFCGSAIFTLRAYFDFVGVSDVAVHESYNCLLPGIMVTSYYIALNVYYPTHVTFTGSHEHQPQRHQDNPDLHRLITLGPSCQLCLANLKAIVVFGVPHHLDKIKPMKICELL